ATAVKTPGTEEDEAKVIQLAQHRGPATPDRLLSAGERNAFAEIGEKLRHATETGQERTEPDLPDAVPEAEPPSQDTNTDQPSPDQAAWEEEALEPAREDRDAGLSGEAAIAADDTQTHDEDAA